MKLRLLFWGYVATIVSLLLYSYTQVDLSLTLSRLSFWQTLEKSFQYIGYFQRPMSTALYLIIILLLSGFYITFIRLVALNKLSKAFVWQLILLSGIVLFFSYNAFSYDFFNYIFDAKIFTNYHLNPYQYMALNFPHDPMLSFMHWTHRTYPYGPVWLMATIPLSFIGLQYFLLTFFLFKALVVGSFLGSVYFLQKILRKTMPGEEVMGMVLFGLSPLVMIESLVSGHLDIFMIFLAMAGLYVLIIKKYISAFVLLFLSIGVKFGTAALVPIFLYAYGMDLLKKKIAWKHVFLASALLMIAPVVAATLRTTFQPWYVLLFLPLAALLGKKYYSIIPSVVLSFFILLEYVPYLYTGNWDPPIPTILTVITVAAVAVCLVCMLGYKLRHLFFVRETR